MKTLLFTALFAATALAHAAPAAHEHDAHAMHAASAPANDTPVHAAEYHTAMMNMHDDMMKGINLQNPDAAFAAGARAAGQKLLDTGLPRADHCYAAMLAVCSEG